MKIQPLLLAGLALAFLSSATDSAIAQGTNTVSIPDEASLDYALANSGVVNFSCDGTIDITATKVITADITLDGTGHQITISGNHSVGVFNVSPGVHLTLIHLTIANGQCSPDGAGIHNNGGIVTVRNCAFTNNAAIGNADGTTGAGGGICNTNSGSVDITGSMFFGNSATGGAGNAGVQGSQQYGAGGPGGEGGAGIGGAVCNSEGGNVSVTNCTFYGNIAIGGNGGVGGRGFDGYTYSYICGSYSCGFFSTCYYYCTGTVYGGAGGLGGHGGVAYGGNIHNSQGTVTLINNTVAGGSSIAGNGGTGGSPGSHGSGSYGPGPGGSAAGGNIGHGGGSFEFMNTIVADPAQGGNYSGGAITDSGNNLSSDGTLAFTAASSYNHTNPNLGPLTYNGGQTMTMALSPESPAIDKGQTVGGLATDQRGLPRSSGNGFDIGAYEYQVVGLDIGLRVYDGTSTVSIACEGPTSMTSPIRFSKNGIGYGILLTAPDSPNASRIRIQTPTGTKAWMKWP